MNQLFNINNKEYEFNYDKNTLNFQELCTKHGKQRRKNILLSFCMIIMLFFLALSIKNINYINTIFSKLIHSRYKSKNYLERHIEKNIKKAEVFYIDNLHKISKEYNNTKFINNTYPLVSVIIPVYNSAEFLNECLDSIISQTLKNIEIICIDDGSEDNSLDIIKQYAEKDKRFIILTQKNSGGGAARNKGLDIAKGKYLSFLDSDDFFEKTMLEEAYNQIEKYNADICVYKSRYFDNISHKSYSYKRTFVEDNLPYRSFNNEVFSPEDLGSKIFNTFYPFVWNKMFNRNFIKIKRIRFQEILRSNDVYFTNSALINANKITILRKELIYYRTKNNNKCQSTLYKAPIDFHKALYLVYSEIMKHHSKEKLISFYNYYFNNCIYNLNALSKQNKGGFADLYNYLHEEGFKIINITLEDEKKLTNESKENYKKCLMIQKYSYDQYMIQKMTVFTNYKNHL